MTVAQTIATNRKNAVEDVRVALTSFNGRDVIGVRVFAEFSGSGGEKKLTKKGHQPEPRKSPQPDRCLAAYGTGGSTMTMSLVREHRRVMHHHANEADRAVEGDRLFLTRRMSRTYRVRLLSWSKKAQIGSLQSGTVNLNPEAPVALVALKQLAPGTRIKAVVFGHRKVIGEELTEVRAQSVLDRYANKHPHVRAREAMLGPPMRRVSGLLHNGWPSA